MKAAAIIMTAFGGHPALPHWLQTRAERLSKVQLVDQRMRLECGVGFRQLRTCRRIPPEAAMCQIQTLAPEKTHLLACLLAVEAFEAVELW